MDDDINLDTWNNLAVNWFRGINTVLGAQRTGIYGHAQACRWAINDAVIGHSSTAGHLWAWQTRRGPAASVSPPRCCTRKWSTLRRILVRFLAAYTSMSTKYSPQIMGNGLQSVIGGPSGVLHEISGTGSAFLRRHHLGGNIASPSQVIRHENQSQLSDQ